MLTNYTTGKFTSDKIEFCVILNKFMRWWHDLQQFAAALDYFQSLHQTKLEGIEEQLGWDIGGQ